MLNSEDGLIATIGALIPSGAGIGVVTGALEEMRKKLVETANSWVELARVKKEDLVTDVQMVATYVGDYAKGFASMAAGLASNAVVWVKNTAVMVASTAAQWAQTAATTAWQGVCVAATAVTTAFGAAMQFLTSPIGIAVAAIAGVIAVAALLVANWDTVMAKTKEVWGAVRQKLIEFSGYITGAFAQDWSEVFGSFGHILNGFFANVKNIGEAVKTALGGIITFIRNVFSGKWQEAWEGIKTVFAGIWNGLAAIIKVPLNRNISMVNALVSAVCNGVNSVLQMLNGLHFTIPDWVPGLGGSSFGFQIAPLKAPQIPYLARGAVLPANRPFLAVVGDQRHGTNVEAPLTTIQEAVGVVMHDHIAAMMAGFEALLEEQRALRELVAEIEIGDTVIGEATERYFRKMAVIRGG